MYMERTTSGAAGNGLYTTIKYTRGAAGIGLGTTIKYLVKKMRAQAATWPRPTYTKVGNEFRRIPL